MFVVQLTDGGPPFDISSTAYPMISNMLSLFHGAEVDLHNPTF